MRENDTYLRKVLEATDSLYFKYLLNLYEIGTAYKSVEKKYQQIDAMLEKYAEASSFMGSAPVNDYMGFKIEFFEKHNAEIMKLQSSALRRFTEFLYQLDFTQLPSGCYYLLYFLHLHRSLHDFPANNPSVARKADSGEALTDKEVEALRCNYRNYLKWKLLDSLFRGDNMSEIYIAPMLTAIDSVCLDFPDDPYQLDTAEKIKHRFIGSLKGNKKIDVYKFLGLLAGRKREMAMGELEYLESVVRYHDGDYEGAVRYSGKVSEAHLDYGAAVAVRLECYAKTGDRAAFLDCLQNRLKYVYGDTLEAGQKVPTVGNGASLNKYYLNLLSCRLILNLPDSDLQELEDQFDTYLNALRSCNPANYEDWHHICDCHRLAVKIMEELMEILEEDKCSADLSREFTASVQSELKKRRLFMALSALQVLDKDTSHELDTFLKQPADDQYDELKKSLCRASFSLLTHNLRGISPEEDLANITALALFFYRTGHTPSFLDLICRNLHYFEKHVDNQGILEILQLAYIEFEASDTSFEQLSNIIAKHCSVSQDTVKAAKIKSKLSPQGKKAYDFALWQFAQSQKEDYGWRDAGLISLAFFRILELEINTKIVKPLVDQINPVDLDQIYKAQVKSLTADSARNYENKWGKNVSALVQAAKNSALFKGMELGSLHYLFKHTTRAFDPNDPTAVYLKGRLDNLYDSTKVNIAKITSYDNRERYRNPPAHTSYLPYSVARESKIFTEDSLLQLFDSMF